MASSRRGRTNQIPVRLTIDGLQDQELLEELKAFLNEQASFNRLCTRVVIPKEGPGIGIEISVRAPETAIFVWHDYVVEARGFMGEIYLRCHKAHESG